MISATFYFRWICHSGIHHDDLDAWCAGSRSMDCTTETAMTA